MAVTGVPTEAAEQTWLFTWAAHAQARIPELRLLHAIPNGGARHPAVAGQLKAQGVKAGVPDTLLPVARNGHHGLYVEMKRRKGSTVSPEQKQWIADLQGEGYYVAVAKGWDAARAIILDYLGVDDAV